MKDGAEDDDTSVDNKNPVELEQVHIQLCVSSKMIP
jgi:hypothetical protein